MTDVIILGLFYALAVMVCASCVVVLGAALRVWAQERRRLAEVRQLKRDLQRAHVLAYWMEGQR